MRALLFIIIVFGGCRAVPPAEGDAKDISRNTDKPMLAFLSFRINNGGAARTVVLLTASATDGRTQVSLPVEGNYITVSLLDSKKNALSSTSLQHPIFAEVEAVTAEKTFQRHVIERKESEFFVRLPFPPGVRFISINETVNGSKTEIAILPYPGVK